MSDCDIARSTVIVSTRVIVPLLLIFWVFKQNEDVEKEIKWRKEMIKFIDLNRKSIVKI